MGALDDLAAEIQMGRQIKAVRRDATKDWAKKGLKRDATGRYDVVDKRGKAIAGAVLKGAGRGIGRIVAGPNQ